MWKAFLWYKWNLLEMVINLEMLKVNDQTLCFLFVKIVWQVVSNGKMRGKRLILPRLVGIFKVKNVNITLPGTEIVPF